MKKTVTKSPKNKLQKTPTGIAGFDAIACGGLPTGRTTLVCGGPGCGKTLFGIEFLIRGITEFGEPGVFISFEETPGELRENYSSLGGDIQAFIDNKQLAIDHVHFEDADVAAGPYDLQALFLRISGAIRSIKAKRVVIDTLETLFTRLDEKTLRPELRRLFELLKDEGVTTILTGERGDGSLTRFGLEEYVSDCVVFLDHRMSAQQLSTRRLRIIKYRGSVHGTNEYPFIIGARGISVFPITSIGLDYSVTTDRISTGVSGLDDMLGGIGYYKGSTVLISGTAGTGKTSFAALFADAASKRGEKCLYFSFEESAAQIVRNMQSIGINFEAHLRKDMLKFHNVRPTAQGLEQHLVMLHDLITSFNPTVVILDPISNLISQGNSEEVKSMLIRIIDFLKQRHITTIMTNLTSRSPDVEHIEINVSSIADTWILTRDVEIAHELRRGIAVVKSRGMPHSNQVRPFKITDHGIDILPPRTTTASTDA